MRAFRARSSPPWYSVRWMGRAGHAAPFLGTARATHTRTRLQTKTRALRHPREWRSPGEEPPNGQRIAGAWAISVALSPRGPRARCDRMPGVGCGSCCTCMHTHMHARAHAHAHAHTHAHAHARGSRVVSMSTSLTRRRSCSRRGQSQCCFSCLLTTKETSELCAAKTRLRS